MGLFDYFKKAPESALEKTLPLPAPRTAKDQPAPGLFTGLKQALKKTATSSTRMSAISLRRKGGSSTSRS